MGPVGLTASPEQAQPFNVVVLTHVAINLHLRTKIAFLISITIADHVSRYSLPGMWWSK